MDVIFIWDTGEIVFLIFILFFKFLKFKQLLQVTEKIVDVSHHAKLLMITRLENKFQYARAS